MGEWVHARWFEPHEAVPVSGSVQTIRAHGGRLGAECATCHEVLLPAPTQPGAPRTETANERKTDGE